MRPTRFAFEAGIWLLVLSGLLCTGIGLSRLLLSRGHAGDLRVRWVGQQYVLQGQNPYDVMAATLEPGRVPPSEQVGDVRVDPALGCPGLVGDPPWGFPVAGWFLFPPWPSAKAWFAFWSLLAWGAVARWAWGVGKVFGQREARFCAAAVLAISCVGTGLALGQNTLLVVALLVAASRLCRRGNPVLAGLFLAMAAWKPTIAAPFFVVFAVRGQWKTLGMALAGMSVFSCITWWWVSTPPWILLWQSWWGWQPLLERGYGLLRVLPTLGVPEALAMPLLASIVTLGGGGVLWRLRDASWEVLLAVAAVWGRLWSYHQVYDNCMLVFLLMAVAKHALAKTADEEVSFGSSARGAANLATVPSWGACLAVGFTLWIPSRFTDALAVQVAQHGIWVFVCLPWLVARGLSFSGEDSGRAATSPWLRRFQHCHRHTPSREPGVLDRAL